MATCSKEPRNTTKIPHVTKLMQEMYWGETNGCCLLPGRDSRGLGRKKGFYRVLWSLYSKLVEDGLVEEYSTV